MEERLEAGVTAGDYVVEAFLGAGAMGEVYAGRHPVIGKRVAIKVLRRELATTTEGAERFIREARAGNQVDHPNVIDVFGFGKLADGRLYLAMDLVPGKSLRKAIEHGPLEPRLAVDVLDQIAAGLDAAHARGVIHRDLKPDNVMLGDQQPPHVHVLDFGIAKLVTTDGPAGPATGKGAWVGTPAYMAPEQWGADGAGPASDRYALGVMAFELLTGKLPFAADSTPAMMEQHFRASVPALASQGASLPPAADRVIARALAKDPAARYATARELVAALREAIGAGPPERSTPRRSWLPAAAGLGVLGVSVFGVVALRSDDERKVAPPARATRHIDVISVPDKAAVTRSGTIVGTTPLVLDAQPGETLALTLTRPGYRAVRVDMTVRDADEIVRKDLVAEMGYEGTWRLPTGELRAFRHSDERVEVYKLAAVTGPRELFRHYDLVAPQGSADVAFAASEEMIDPRAPDDPGCHVPLRVEYRYRAANDLLELRRERVALDVKDGHCIVVERDPGESASLERVDKNPTDPRWTQPPVGDLKAPTKTRAPIDLKALEDKAKKGAIRQGKKLMSKEPPPAPKTDEKPIGSNGNSR